MAKYERILLATDFCSDNNRVIERAAETASSYGAELWVIHVIEPLPLAYGGDATGMWAEQFSNLQSDLNRGAGDMMTELEERLSVPHERTLVTQGRAATEIRGFAEDNKIDLIVMGTHGQHGLGLLLGSTANSVLHGISCDSLIVKIGK